MAASASAGGTRRHHSGAATKRPRLKAEQFELQIQQGSKGRPTRARWIPSARPLLLRAGNAANESTPRSNDSPSVCVTAPSDTQLARSYAHPVLSDPFRRSDPRRTRATRAKSKTIPNETFFAAKPSSRACLQFLRVHSWRVREASARKTIMCRCDFIGGRRA